jgi:hypothetical protein
MEKKEQRKFLTEVREIYKGLKRMIDVTLESHKVVDIHRLPDNIKGLLGEEFKRRTLISKAEFKDLETAILQQLTQEEITAQSSYSVDLVPDIKVLPFGSTFSEEEYLELKQRIIGLQDYEHAVYTEIQDNVIDVGFDDTKRYVTWLRNCLNEIIYLTAHASRWFSTAKHLNGREPYKLYYEDYLKEPKRYAKTANFFVCDVVDNSGKEIMHPTYLTLGFCNYLHKILRYAEILITENRTHEDFMFTSLNFYEQGPDDINGGEAPPRNRLFKHQYDVALYYEFTGIYQLLLDKLKKKNKALQVIAEWAGIDKWTSLNGRFTAVSVYDPRNEECRKLFNPESLKRVIDLMERQGFDTAKLCQIQDKVVKR